MYFKHNQKVHVNPAKLSTRRDKDCNAWDPGWNILSHLSNYLPAMKTCTNNSRDMKIGYVMIVRRREHRQGILTNKYLQEIIAYPYKICIFILQ